MANPISSSQDLPKFQYIDPFDNMPILEKDKFGNDYPPPIEKRGPEYRKYLAPSVRILVTRASGSGTIIHHDKKKNIAYVATCGHLWSRGVMNAQEGKKQNIKCKIIVWYHNDRKLDTPKSYDGDVIFYSNNEDQDTGLVTFTPDWEPNVFPIGPVEYKYINGQFAHSVGCDQGTEVAHYDVEMKVVDERGLNTIRNSPRPGRSGGGLMNDNGLYIGTCIATQYLDGTGLGFFTPLKLIHKFWSKQKGYEFLLEQKDVIGKAKEIKIIDRNNSQENFKPDYILLP